jgi:hypothetical protein
MRRSARDDLDVGQPEPRSTVATDDRKAMGGQQAPEIGRHSGERTASLVGVTAIAAATICAARSTPTRVAVG